MGQAPGAWAGRLPRAVMATAGLLMLALAGLGWSFPALAASACPGCFHLLEAGPGLFVEGGFTEAELTALRSKLAAARDTVAAFYGESPATSRVLSCASRDCERRLGGRGARAFSVFTPWGSVVVLTPRGLETTIIAHELSHVETHRRVGFRRALTGEFPAWFDEGLAVIVSDDARYLHPGNSAAERCTDSSSEALPDSPFEWARRSGVTPMLYASAACRVLQWSDRHGGRSGLIAALDQVGSGGRRLP